METTNQAGNQTTNQALQAEIVALSAEVGEALRARGLHLATAESCTGGLIGHLMTEIPGSSDYFTGGAITYSNAAKEAALGVRHATLEAHGAVSYETAAEMAAGARRRYGTEIGVSVTGIAGPGGDVPGKPSGTVFIHLSAADGFERGERFLWQSDRSGNKLLSARAAIELVREYLSATQ